MEKLKEETEAAKGGAKSVMNRRKNQQGRSFDGNRNRKFQEGEEGSGGGEGGSSEPCVGLCLHMLNAITIIVITIVNSNIITIVTVVNSSTILNSMIRRERGLTYPPPPLHP